VPLLVSGAPIRPGVNLGVRETFADLGATIADVLGEMPPPCGTSFKSMITR
jgi:phosphopentomutase